MTFIQIIEVTTTRPEEMQELVKEWSAKTEGRRTAYRSTLTADRDRPNTYVRIVEFPSYQEAMTNSGLPETAEFAEKLARSATARRCSVISTYGESTSSPEPTDLIAARKLSGVCFVMRDPQLRSPSLSAAIELRLIIVPGRTCLSWRPQAPVRLFGLDPAEQVLPADCLQQGRMVAGHMPPDHPDHLVIAIAAGHEPALAPDQLRHRASPPSL